ncbi:MAG: acyltransferase [Aquabacterium sp.]|nr:acyltransferase [Aquabacterium sp.]
MPLSPPDSTSARTLPMLASLDGLRALAVLLVIPHNAHLPAPADSLVTRLLEQWLDRGWIGVQLFFVLSGFLITRILMRTQSASNYFSGFYIRRALRIWPLYYATLVVLLWVMPRLGWVANHDQSHDLYLWTFTSNWVHGHALSGARVPHFWSLAVEEQFYLVWPLLLYRAGTKRVLLTSALVAVSALIIRHSLLSQGWDPEAVYTATLARMDALAWGAAGAALMELACVRQWLNQHRLSAWAVPLGLLLIGAAVSGGYKQLGWLPQTAGYTLLASAFAALVMCAAAGDQGWIVRCMAWSRMAVMRRIGQYSFGMYVFHAPLSTLVLLPLAKHWGWLQAPTLLMQLAYIGLCMLGSMVLAALSYHGFEQHFLSLKARWAPVRQ